MATTAVGILTRSTEPLWCLVVPSRWTCTCPVVRRRLRRCWRPGRRVSALAPRTTWRLHLCTSSGRIMPTWEFPVRPTEETANRSENHDQRKSWSSRSFVSRSSAKTNRASKLNLQSYTSHPVVKISNGHAATNQTYVLIVYYHVERITVPATSGGCVRVAVADF